MRDSDTCPKCNNDLFVTAEQSFVYCINIRCLFMFPCDAWLHAVEVSA